MPEKIQQKIIYIYIYIHAKPDQRQKIKVSSIDMQAKKFKIFNFVNSATIFPSRSVGY